MQMGAAWSLQFLIEKKQYQRRMVLIHASSLACIFFQESFKGVNCSATIQNPMALASKCRRKKF